MLQAPYERAYASSSNAPARSSFDRWLERTQRKGNDNGRGGEGQGETLHRNYPLHFHVDPRGAVRSPAPAPDRLEQLEGLLFTRGYFNPLGAPSDGASYTIPDAFPGAEPHEGRYSSPLPGMPLPTQRPLHLPMVDNEYSSVGGSGALSTLNEPFGFHREPYGSYPLLAGGSEAERYIARLEEEVQMLMTESGEKDRMTMAAVASKDAMAMQLEEMRRRSEVERDEHTAAQTITYSFLRTLSFHRLLEERSKAMELNTQISLLKHELKLAEAMRAQAQAQATTVAASSTAAQALQRQLEEQSLANSVTSTVRNLLQQEYTRLAEVMSEMPSKMQTILDKKQSKVAVAEESSTPSSTPPPPPPLPTHQQQHDGAEAAEQRRLCALLESALTAVSAQNKTSNDLSKDRNPPAVEEGRPTETLRKSDSARLLTLVSRMRLYQDTVLDLYCDAVDAKSSLAQYEHNIVRLIHEKQSALTWATLYEEKKDEVRHLNEKLMEMRGELRAATSTLTMAGASPRGWNGATSLAGSTSSQSYEAYAAPFVPVKKPAAHKIATDGSTANGCSVGHGSAQTKTPTSVAAPKKSIAELREEARHLGAHPAVHYPLLVTSPSPSMPSLYVSHSPIEVEQTVLQQPSLVQEETRRTTPESQSSPPSKSLGVAPIRAFVPRSVSRTSSTASSASSSSSMQLQAEAAAKNAEVTKKAASASPHVTSAVAGRSTSNTKKPVAVSTRPRSPSSSSSASSLPPAHVPATPVPASRKPQTIMPTVQRLTTTASSSSLSSTHSASVTKPSVSPAASRPAVVVQAVHNSFDDDNDSDGDNENLKKPSAAAAASAARQLGKAGAATTSSSRKTSLAPTPTPTAATSVAKKPVLQVTRVSLGETVKALERAKRLAAGEEEDESDAGTSSLSLSTSSSSSSPPPPVQGNTATTSKAAPATGKKRDEATHSHPRRSSFDDDDEDEDGGSSTNGNNKRRHKPANTAPMPLSLKGKASTAKSSVPSAASPASKAVAPALSVAASKGPQKLKLPTW